MQDFHQLNVWKKAHSLVLRVYRASDDLPASENFGLVLNLRRSAVVIARSIAEGTGRDSDAEFATDLKKARAAGSPNGWSGISWIPIRCPATRPCRISISRKSRRGR